MFFLVFYITFFAWISFSYLLFLDSIDYILSHFFSLQNLPNNFTCLYFPPPSAQESCKTCPEGYYCPVGTDTPQACPAGTFNPLVGQDAEIDCTACTAGMACTTVGLVEPDTPCYPG